MNLKKQYTLPSCTLTLQGLSSDFGGFNAQNSRSSLTILTDSQCQFVGSKQVLHGGRAFLENLMAAVSNYAQGCLSGVHHPLETSQREDHIQLEPLPNKKHRLVWYPSPEANEPTSPVMLDLTALQLFDLMEALDQLLQDPNTLPDLNLTLKPLSRRYRQGDEPLGKKAVPFALGLGSLALTALVMYFVPFPQEVRPPEPKPAASPGETIPQPQNLPPSR